LSPPYKWQNSSLEIKTRLRVRVRSTSHFELIKRTWKIPEQGSLSGGGSVRWRGRQPAISPSRVLRCVCGKTQAWAFLDDCHYRTASPSIPSAVAVIHGHLGLPSWLVLTRLAEWKEEQGQMVLLNWQGWRGWHRAGRPSESQTAGSHLDPAGAARA